MSKKPKKIERPDWWYMIHPTEQSREEWWQSPPGLNTLTTVHRIMEMDRGFHTRMLRYLIHQNNIRGWSFHEESLTVYVTKGLTDKRKVDIQNHIAEGVIEVTIREIAKTVDMPINLVHYILSRLRVVISENDL